MKHSPSFDINLWSVESKWKKLFNRPGFLSIGAILLVSWLWTSIIGWYHLCEARQLREIAALESQVADRGGGAETEALAKRVAQLKSGAQTIEKDRLDFPGLLAQVQAAIPPEVTLQQVYITENRLVCRGTAPGYPEVAQYMISLDKAEYLNEPVCSLAETYQEGIRFDILLQISPGGGRGE